MLTPNNREREREREREIGREGRLKRESVAEGWERDEGEIGRERE